MYIYSINFLIGEVDITKFFPAKTEEVKKEEGPVKEEEDAGVSPGEINQHLHLCTSIDLPNALSGSL
jgi:hypothetical protein